MKKIIKIITELLLTFSLYSLYSLYSLAAAEAETSVKIKTISSKWYVPVNTEVFIGTLTVIPADSSFPDYRIFFPEGIKVTEKENRRIYVTVLIVGSYETKIVTIPRHLFIDEPIIEVGKVLLRWRHIEGTEYYKVCRKIEGEEEEFLFLGTTTENRFVDHTVEGKIYLYKIEAFVGKELIIIGSVLVAIPYDSLKNSFWYPNPCTQQVVVFTNLPKIATIEIYDISGMLVIKERAEGPKWTVDLSSLSSGVYLIVLKAKDAKDEIKIGKLVILR